MQRNSKDDLREGADLFRAVFNLAPVGIALIEPDGRWLRINARLCQIVGYSAEELENLNIQELTHPDDMEKHLQHIHRLLSGEIDNYTMEKRYFHKDGSIIQANVAVSLVRDRAGAPEYFIAIVEDVTARKAAEETQRDCEALFRIIFDQAFQMMGLMKPDGTLITINRTAAEFIKTKQPGTLSKAISMHTWETYFTMAEQKGEALLDKPFWELPWWADSPELQECLRGAVQTASRGEAVRSEAHFQTVQGKTRWVDLYLTPMKDDSGNVVLLVPEARDITENKLAEQAMRESEHTFAKLFRCSPSVVVVSSTVKEARVIEVNEAFERVTKYRREEVVGRSSIELGIWVDPDDRTNILETLRSDGDVRDRNVRFRDKNGTIFLGSYSGSIVEIGGETCLLSMVVDITERRREEEEHARLAAIVESSDDAIIGHTLEGIITDWNRGAEKIYGYTADEAIGRSLSIIASMGRSEEIRHLLDSLKRGERIRPVETMCSSKDGTEIHVSLTVSPIIDAEGKMTGGSSIARDITERKLAELYLRKSEELLRDREDRLRLAIESAEIGTFDYSFQAGESIWSDLTKLHFGLPADAPVEGDIFSFLEGVHPDDYERVKQLAEDALRPERGGDYKAEYRTIGIQDGKERWIAARGRVYFDGSGQPVRVIGTTLDFTESKQAEQSLRDSESFKQDILDSLPAHIAVLDQDGMVRMVNRSWIRFAEANGLPDPRAVCAGADYLAVCRRAADSADPLAREGLEGIESVLYGCKPEFMLEYPCHSPTQQHWFLMNVIRPSHHMPGAVITHLDITERKLAENEIAELNRYLAARASDLEAANQEMETFGYSLTHDLRKPLTIINGYCQVILEAYGDTLEDECKKYLAEIYNGSLRMNQLIDALLKFSVLTRSELRREQVDLSDMAKTVAAELRGTEAGRKVTFEIMEGITVYGDRALLQIVMDNLLGNAWKYTSKEQQASIEFGVREIQGEATYFVRDNGTGFDMAYAEKLFVPFERLPGTDEFKGHGIGLATVARVIKRHGGKVWAEGEPGKGATFYFTLST